MRATDSTLLADVARAATGGSAPFVAFQAASALLRLAAVTSSCLGGSGPLEELAAHGGDGEGLLPRWRTWAARGRPSGIARIAT